MITQNTLQNRYIWLGWQNSLFQLIFWLFLLCLCFWIDCFELTSVELVYIHYFPMRRMVCTLWVPVQNAKSFVLTRPPAVLFACCLAAFGVVTLSLGLYVKHTSSLLKNPDEMVNTLRHIHPITPMFPFFIDSDAFFSMYPRTGTISNPNSTRFHYAFNPGWIHLQTHLEWSMYQFRLNWMHRLIKCGKLTRWFRAVFRVQILDWTTIPVSIYLFHYL